MTVENDSKNGFMEVQTYVDNGEEDNSARVPVDVTAPGTFEIDGNGVRRRDAAEYVAYSDDNGHEQTVLSTLRNSSGSMQSDFTNLDPHRCSVEVDGMRTSLANAIRLGYVLKDGNGYRDGVPGETYIPADIKPEVNMSPAVHESVSKLRAAVGHNNADAMLHSVIGAVLNSEVDDDTAFGTFSSQLGLEVEEGAEAAKAITEDLGRNLVDKTAAKYSLDAHELISFLRSCTPEIRTQLVLRTLHGDPSVFQELASRHRFKNIR